MLFATRDEMRDETGPPRIAHKRTTRAGRRRMVRRLALLAVGASENSTVVVTEEPFFDAYTITAIVLLSCLGLILVVRFLFTIVSCRVAVERKPPPTCADA